MSNFNAIDYMFLNPELVAYQNVRSVEQAFIYYTANSNANLATNVSSLPSNFDSEVFLASSRDLANISSLSRDIEYAMCNFGLTPNQIAKKQKYIPNIYQAVTYNGSNVFAFIGSNIITSNNLVATNSIRVIDTASTEMFFKVASVTSNQFTVQDNNAALFPSSNYMLYGINVTDYDRISQINFFRIILGYSNVDSNGLVVSAVTSAATNYLRNESDSNFNSALYKVLYPDARSLTDTQVYLDWVNKRKNEIYRIINVEDIAAGNGNKYVNFNFLNISSNVVFRGKFVDGITSNLDPALCNLPGDSNKLITEYAIKTYLDTRMSNLQNLGSFTNMMINDSIIVSTSGSFSNTVNVFGSLYVNSNSSFSNNVTIVGNTYIKSNLDVTRTSVFRNSMMLDGGNANATFCNCVLVNGSMSVTGNIYNARIGLGHMGGFLTSNNGSNIIQAQNYNDNSDARIKTNIAYLLPKDCLDKICKMDVATFNYCYGHSNKDSYTTTGAIAQQLEECGLSEYVYLTSGYLPDVMKNGEIDGNYIYVDHDLLAGRNLKLVVDNNDIGVQVLRKLERGVFQISPGIIGERKPCLIYGYHTDELKNVDYKQLFVIAIGAIKHLASLVQ